MKKIFEIFGGYVNRILRLLGIKIITLTTLRYYTDEEFLYTYDSYEEYKQSQVFHNRRKIERVWADKETLSIIAKFLRSKFRGNENLFGLCHGSRNGYETKWRALHTSISVGHC